MQIDNLLLTDKVDAMVELTLPEKTNIYTSQYWLYLPDKKLLQKNEEIHERKF